MLQTTETRGNEGIYLPTNVPGLSRLWQDFKLTSPLELDQIVRTQTRQPDLPILNNEFFEAQRKARADQGHLRLGRSTKLALAVAGVLILAAGLISTGKQPSISNAAEYQGPKIETATPVPTSLLRTTALPKSILRSVDSQVACLDPIKYQDCIDFYITPDNYNWNNTNASYGKYPPNNPGIQTGTVRVNINGIYQNKDFQPLQNLYKAPLVGLNIGGMAVNVNLDRYYLGTNTWKDQDPAGYDIFAAHSELGIGVTTPYSYTGRLMADRNLPVIYGDSSQYITLGTDINGNYLNMMFDDAVDPVKNGTYQIRLDQNGIFIGDTFILLSDNPTATATLTPTLTSTATVTSTITSTPTSTPSPVPTLVLPFHSYLPGVMKN